MVISDPHKYVFIELPQTGSSTIAQELCERYGGRRILSKHATYRDFLRVATQAEKSYFVFSGIRNPMDKALSLYFKYKTDHSTKKKRNISYGDAEFYSKSNIFISWLMRNQYKFVHLNDASFIDFFKRYYFIPFDDWSCLDHSRLDYVVHFENLSTEFETALEKIGIKPERQLPIRNKTHERDGDFLTYYPREIHRRARWVFGPYFKRWGYTFPTSWPSQPVFLSNEIFWIANVARKIYWRYLR